MKILKLFGAIVAVHAAVFIFAFVMPGCRSSARTSSTPPPGAAQLPPPAAAPGAAHYQAPGSPYDGGASTFAPPPVAYSDFGVPPATDFGAPPPPPPAPPSWTPAEVTGVVPLSSYTVLSGDSLWTISRKKGVSVNEIKAANNLKTNNLKVGQKLVIPAKQAAAGATATPGGAGRTDGAFNAAPAPTTSTYTVVAGDSLDRIARRHGVTVAKIKELSNLTSNSIVIGQKLTLPAPDSTHSGSFGPPPPAGARPAGNAPTTTLTHIVQGGETLGGIAKKYGVPQREIAVANHISDPRLLQAGQELVIPGVPASPFEQPAPSAQTAGTPPPTTPTTPASPVSTSPVSSPVNSSPISSAPLDAPPVNAIESAPSPVTPQGQ
ncbi:MAG: LysM peptidoglycan-binding domain-containing protein [Opitutaceae bacterium]|jgi:LysM repeat protein|nr:LysM peptidoglycan-binding domain-containing protein [Opitutaceae bacterium]